MNVQSDRFLNAGLKYAETIVCKFLWPVLFAFLPSSLFAQLVDFNQNSDPAGIISQIGEATVGEFKYTVPAPVQSNDLIFYGWYNHAGTRLCDANGQAVNPAQIYVLEPITVTAKYVASTNDFDGDGVLDWYELYHYGDLDTGALDDTDGDGYSLAEEFYREYDPHVPDSLLFRIVSGSEPESVSGVDDVYVDGSFNCYTTASLYGVSGDYRFTQWSVDGIEVRDVLGRAIDPITVDLIESQRVYNVTAHYTLADEDTDADGVLDWFEIDHFGDLSMTSSNDVDGDGISLLLESQYDTHPQISNSVQVCHLSCAATPVIDFVYPDDFFYLELSEPSGIISNDWIVQPDTVITASADSVVGSLVFAGWECNGVPVRGPTGQAVNPVVSMVTNDITLVASYTEETADGDSDGIPDWYELFNYGSTNVSADVDADGDGYGMYEEWYRGYDPHVAEPVVYRIVDSSLPVDVFSSSELYYDGASNEYVTASRYGVSGDYRFTHWSVNGIDVRDVLGRAVDPITVDLVDSQRVYNVTTHYTLADEDTDADGVLDWFEIHHFGDLSMTSTNDVDGDGISLLLESQYDTHPQISNSVEVCHLSCAATPVIDFVYPDDFFYLELSEPSGIISNDWIIQPGTVITASAESVVGTLKFSGWECNSVPVRGPTGQAVNPVVSVVTNDITLIALYTEETADGDVDGIPDWYELYNYGATNVSPEMDADGDGYGMYEEWYRGYDPHVDDPVVYRIVDSSLPTGVFNEMELYYPVSSNDYFTASRYGIISDFRFTHWSVNGVEVRDLFGRAVDPITVNLVESQRVYNVVAHYTAVYADTDEDGVPDWFEIHHFSDLSMSATNDVDRDGISLLQESQYDTHPQISNSMQVCHLVSAASTTFDFWLRDYFPIQQDGRLDGVMQPIFTGSTSTNGLLDFTANSHPALGDWDGDGDLDLFVGSSNATMRVFENAGSPVIMNWVERTSNFVSMASCWTNIVNPAPALGDWSGDGCADLAVGGGTGVVTFVQSQGTFTELVACSSWLFDCGSSMAVPAFGDINKDGWQDLLVLTDAGVVQCYTNTQQYAVPFTQPPFTTDLTGTTVPNACGLSVQDINHDGVNDLLISDKNGNIWEFHGGVD